MNRADCCHLFWLTSRARSSPIPASQPLTSVHLGGHVATRCQWWCGVYSLPRGGNTCSWGEIRPKQRAIGFRASCSVAAAKLASCSLAHSTPQATRRPRSRAWRAPLLIWIMATATATAPSQLCALRALYMAAYFVPRWKRSIAALAAREPSRGRSRIKHT